MADISIIRSLFTACNPGLCSTFACGGGGGAGRLWFNKLNANHWWWQTLQEFVNTFIEISELRTQNSELRILFNIIQLCK